MRNLLKLILKFNFFIIFIVILFVSIFLLRKNNSNSSISNKKGVFSSFYTFREYLNIKEVNNALLSENTSLRNLIAKKKQENLRKFKLRENVIYNQQFKYSYAKVINNSINKQFNFLTLNKGSKHGIKSGMAVISSHGIVGVVYNVSTNYSTVISLLNTKLNISAKFKKNNYFGLLNWNGENYRMLNLKEIPHHVKININDTIITSGYSKIFPKGIPIGVVKDYTKRKDGNFYNIKVKLFNDFKQIDFVYLIANLKKIEQEKIEKKK